MWAAIKRASKRLFGVRDRVEQDEPPAFDVNAWRNERATNAITSPFTGVPLGGGSRPTPTR